MAAPQRGSSKQLVLLCEPIRTPPFSKAARIEAGTLIRLLQEGILLSMPHSRPMPSIGKRCHELRVVDANVTWRLFYRVDREAIVVIDRLSKKSKKTPKTTIEICKSRLRRYDDARKNTPGE